MKYLKGSGAFMLFFAVSLFSHAQFLPAVGGGNSILRETQYTNVDGSPYLYKEFKEGVITDLNGNTSRDLMIRYDTYRDEVQFIRDGKTLVVNPPMAPSFYFEYLNPETNAIEKLFFRNGFEIEGYSKLNYFQVVYDGNTKFIKKISSVYLEENISNFGTNEQIKKFQSSNKDFLILEGQPGIEVNKNRKDILSHFGKVSGQIKTFIKTNKLNLKDDNDLIAVLKKYDELIAQ